MQAALLPVRSLAGAKGRLGATLSSSARSELTRAMLADMIEALAAAQAISRVFVVSADPALLEVAAALGATPMMERPGDVRGLNVAVAQAASDLAANDVDRLLIIPGDVPLIAADEIDALFAWSAEDYPVILVPSGSGTGTNGLLLSPPDVVRPRFEGASREAHRHLCRETKLTLKEIVLPSFALDVDTPEDLALLASRGANRHAGRAVAKLLSVAA
jgi:2-phospho-L-lactate guanylyltransferase